MNKTSKQTRVSENVALEDALKNAKSELRAEERKSVEEQDSGRLGWLYNHVKFLENRINGTLKGDAINYEILN